MKPFEYIVHIFPIKSLNKDLNHSTNKTDNSSYNDKKL